MTGIKSSTRLAISIGIVGATFLWLAADLRLIPNPVDSVLDTRVALAKVISINATTAVEEKRFLDFRDIAEAMIATNPDLHSICLTSKHSKYTVGTQGHQELWLQKETYPESCRVSADVFQNGSVPWGKLEILFDPENELLVSNWKYPLSQVLFMFAALTVATWMMLGQTFRYLNPSKVVPNRVRSALDTLTEGLVLIDPSGEIVHSNNAFSEMVDCAPEVLIGTKLNEQNWILSDDEDSAMPWAMCFQSRESVRGRILELRVNNRSKKYIVNSSPVLGTGKSLKGALISFDDVTDLEGKKQELAQIILTLRKSRDEVARQNEELYFLANCDPLTKCFNRRSFWNQYNQLWEECEVGELNLMMVDIDHFKSINDNYGHSTGDEVLKANGELLRRVVGERGSVCRYGGEEFVILMPKMSLEDAVGIAHEIHAEYQKVKLGGISVTASLGVSNTALGVMDMQHLLDQADQCLYAAKRNGRNQVVRYDQCDHEMEDAQGDVNASVASPSVNIKHSTVTGLLSALALKCPNTAEHSVRVADLCVAVGQKLISKRNLYRLEVCGLLHDIGKIGVPDNILNKPGPLTDSEWEVMKKHDEYGVSIIKSAFESDEIADIIKHHKESFSTQSILQGSILQANEIPIESRIITACDAFDSMIANRVYRQAQPIKSALNELVRCTPDQFDPVVVEHLIAHVSQPGFMESRNVAVKTSQETAVAIAKHLEDLHSAVANENLRELKEVVDSLKGDANTFGIGMISDATQKLEDIMSTNDSKLSQVMEVAEEVMQLCRFTRSAFVESTEDVTSAG